MEIEFQGLTIIVTGAVRGIGRGIAHALASRGAAVHAFDVLADGLEETVSTASPARGGSIRPVVVDVTDPDAVQAAVAEVEATSSSGAVDVAVHSAGGVRGQHPKAIEEVTPEDWRAIQAVNVDGAFHLARATTPGMKRAGRGRIVVISSRAGLGVSLTGIQSYGTAKAAQIGLVRQLAHELGPYGITVNSVAPGFVRSNPATERQWESYGAEGQKRLVYGVHTKRLGTADDIAAAVLFFASDAAAWISGQVLSVDGGRS